MRTDFTAEQLADPDTAESEKILRTCTHCGFCTATCPTYVLLGDELDSPRGRIYLIKDMLARGESPSADTVKHIDRCLSCLACMTTCPSGVNYMHLVDHARRWIEENYRRPPAERVLRRLLGTVLPRPGLFRLALLSANLARAFARLLPRRLAPLLALTPASAPPPSGTDRARVFPAEGEQRMRVALLPGCAQRVLAPEINEATIRLLTRLGCEVVIAPGVGCCGSLNHHLGQEAAALAFARNNIDAWERERLAGSIDAIVINASGCGTTVKDYAFMLREDSAYAEKAARIAALARDVTEIVEALGLPKPSQSAGRRLRVAYHSACSMQHGQRLHRLPQALLNAVGFETVEVPEGHICCGSAGTYNLLQPEIADKLRERKLANIAKTDPDLVATGNIGCITQLASRSSVPVVHTVELLDWAIGGPEPVAWRRYAAQRRATAGISNDKPSAETPIAVGVNQPAPPEASCSPAAPRSTQAIVIGS
ncbi:MAG: glycolate oxidase subunit GlcF [Alphaproteobacteria bacterium]|nr:glycolate oxidase subunit GlcF [Alphaproteobacteria bacterium]